MGTESPSGKQFPAPSGNGNLDPRLVLGIAMTVGALAAYYVDWRTAFCAFLAVLALFTPPRPKNR